MLHSTFGKLLASRFASAIALGLPTLACADGVQRIVSHSAPHSFYEFLLRHDDTERKFDRSGEWVQQGDATAVVVFAKNDSDQGAIPASLSKLFEAIVPNFKSHFYYITNDNLGDYFDFDVIFILAGELPMAIEKTEYFSLSDLESPHGMTSCFSAGLVNRSLSGGREEVDNDTIVKRCITWISS